MWYVSNFSLYIDLFKASSIHYRIYADKAAHFLNLLQLITCAVAGQNY